MRRWSGQPANPAHFDIARVRQIGEWGHASRYIGSRWEELGGERLLAVADASSVAAFLPIYADSELARRLGATGSKNPDAILVYAEDGALALQPADLKWSLDVASYIQISAAVLDTLLEKVPELGEEIVARVSDGQRDLPLVTRDGFFFAPRTYANERFVGSTENQRQEYPLDPEEVRLEAVDPFDFFERLPGWATARELARFDGSARGLNQIDTADRYYHFGAGVAGALAALESSIFDEEAPIEPEREVERLRDWSNSLRPPSTAAILDRLGVLVRRRRGAIQQLRDLTRGSFSFSQFVDLLIAADRAVPGQSERELRAQWSERYRAVIDVIDADLREEGRARRAAGATDVEALQALERERPAIARRLEVRAQALLRLPGDLSQKE